MNWDVRLADALVAQNPHPELFAKGNLDENGRPRQLLGYFRCDNDGQKWWNTVWRVHDDLDNRPLALEFDSVYEQFCKEFPTLADMTRWCYKNARRITWNGDYEYYAYFEGELGFYWLRMRTRYRDYNLYMYCYSKDAMSKM